MKWTTHCNLRRRLVGGWSALGVGLWTIVALAQGQGNGYLQVPAPVASAASAAGGETKSTMRIGLPYLKARSMPAKEQCGETRRMIGGQQVVTPNLGHYEYRCKKVQHFDQDGRLQLDQEQCDPAVFKRCA